MFLQLLFYLLLTLHFSQLCRPVSTLQSYFGLFPLTWTANEEETNGCPQTQVPCPVHGPEGQGNIITVFPYPVSTHQKYRNLPQQATCNKKAKNYP